MVFIHEQGFPQLQFVFYTDASIVDYITLLSPNQVWKQGILL